MGRGCARLPSASILRRKAGGEVDPTDRPDTSRVHPSLDQFVAQQGEDALADENRPGVAVPVHARSLAQVVLRWHVQHGYIPIPKSASLSRQQENLAVFDFELTPDELAAIDALDRGEAHLVDSDDFGH